MLTSNATCIINKTNCLVYECAPHFPSALFYYELLLYEPNINESYSLRFSQFGLMDLPKTEHMILFVWYTKKLTTGIIQNRLRAHMVGSVRTSLKY